MVIYQKEKKLKEIDSSDMSADEVPDVDLKAGPNELDL